MTSAYDQVRDRVDAGCISHECDKQDCSHACEKQGCEFYLTGVPPRHLIIDMDHLESSAKKKRKRCDYLLVSEGYGRNGLYVVPLELKSSGFRAQAVSKQLEGGAETAYRIVRKVRCGFVPVVVHGGAHRREFNKLAKHPVHFDGDPYEIRTIKCGEDIAKELKRLGLKA